MTRRLLALEAVILALSATNLARSGSAAAFPASPTEAGEDAGAITIDKERREIRFPCHFVNPTQLLEVFACHETGPTHETVVAFQVTGPEIQRALLAIGCRPASYWNATSPRDFLKNQGDRLLVSVKWTHGGKEKEYPAEGVLYDGETRFPAFVRGFSFGARAPPAEGRPGKEEKGGAREERGSTGEEKGGAREEGGARGEGAKEEAGAGGIPEGVEITLGATNRQSPAFSLLSHPTCSARLQRFTLPPVIDTTVVEDLETLVHDRIPATLIIRRLESETELVNAARSAAGRRGLAERLPLYEQLLPIAAEIDDLKREYEEGIKDLRAAVRAIEDGSKLPPDEARALAERSLALLRRGQWLCARIEACYLGIYDLEEAYKLSWIEKQTDLHPEVREEVVALVRYGFHMELLIARKEVEKAALYLPGAPPDPDGFLPQAITHEIEVLRLEQEAGFTRGALEAAERRLKESEDAFTRELFEEDRLRAEWQTRFFGAKQRLHRTLASAFRARHEGGWEEVKGQNLKEQERAEKELNVLELEKQLLEIQEQTRWARSDAESEFPERRDEAKAKLKELNARRRALEEKISAARKAD